MNKNKLWILFIIITCGYSCSEKEIVFESDTLEVKVNQKRTLDYNEHRNAYFGDLHIHSAWSFDAYVSNVRATPDEAYLFGKGESMQHVSGNPIQLNRPLDFMAVSDHAEYMGALIQMSEEGNSLYDLDIAKNIRSKDRNKVIKAMMKLQLAIGLNWPDKDLIQKENLQHIWRKMVEIADSHYEPGVFTTFPAYEWTSSIAVYKSLVAGPRYAQNLHRNVIFKGGKVSAVPFSSFDSQNPERLWEWMELQRSHDIDLLAIPHNGNISDGRMYALNTYDGDKLSEEWIQTRLRNEPVNEVVQIKGQSMTHPTLSPNDEFADFEVYEFALGQGDPRKEVEPDGAYVRQALKNGLGIEKDLGTNPFQFGLIGSSDGHNGGSNIEEDNYIGKSGIKDDTPQKRLSKEKGGIRNRKSSVAGLAGVWAKENTREAIYQALERKEVFATSGPRIKLRFFASWDNPEIDLQAENWDSIAYEIAVPMGSEIRKSNGNSSPSFIISAIKDAEGANLDRVQLIKGWIDDDAQIHEKIYDVAWGENRELDNNGRIQPIENTVDTTTATYTNQFGNIRLQTIWTDPDFNDNHSSFYYLRVLEIPTPRWTTYDAVSLGVDLPNDVSPVIQERAWSSPIWYKALE